MNAARPGRRPGFRPSSPGHRHLSCARVCSCTCARFFAPDPRPRRNRAPDPPGTPGADRPPPVRAGPPVRPAPVMIGMTFHARVRRTRGSARARHFRGRDDDGDDNRPARLLAAPAATCPPPPRRPATDTSTTRSRTGPDCPDGPDRPISRCPAPGPKRPRTARSPGGAAADRIDRPTQASIGPAIGRPSDPIGQRPPISGRSGLTAHKRHADQAERRVRLTPHTAPGGVTLRLSRSPARRETGERPRSQWRVTA